MKMKHRNEMLHTHEEKKKYNEIINIQLHLEREMVQMHATKIS